MELEACCQTAVTSETESSASDNSEEPTAFIAETTHILTSMSDRHAVKLELKKEIELTASAKPEIPDEPRHEILELEVREEILPELQLLQELHEPDLQFHEPSLLVGNGAFKPFMAHHKLSPATQRYQMIVNYGEPDENGLWVIGGQYYAIVMGPHYHNAIGDLWEIGLSSGQVFYGISGDSNYKAIANTHVEFIIHQATLNRTIAHSGSVGSLEHFTGTVVSVTYLGNWFDVYGG